MLIAGTPAGTPAGAQAGGQGDDEAATRVAIELPMPPGADVVESVQGEGTAALVIATELTLEELYAFVHGTLHEAGLLRTAVDVGEDAFLTTYELDGVEFVIEVARHGGGAFRIALELLAAAADATTTAPPLATSEADRALLSPVLDLRAPPGTRIVSARETGSHARVRFESDRTLDQLYAFLHDELSALGWRRSLLDRDRGPERPRDRAAIEARYERGAQRLELELAHDAGGLYEIVLHLQD